VQGDVYTRITTRLTPAGRDPMFPVEM
jgi:hypothetical protein